MRRLVGMQHAGAAPMRYLWAMGVVAIPLALLGACGGGNSDAAGAGGSATGSEGKGGGGTAGSGAYPASTSAQAVAGVIYGSCVPDEGVVNAVVDFNMQTGELIAHMDPACFVGKANGCDALTECGGVTIDQAAPCETACVGQTAEVCAGDGWHMSAACDQLGLHCAPNGECWEQPPGPSCDWETFSPECDGDVAVNCRDGHEQRSNCAAQGRTCGGQPGYFVHCVGAPAPGCGFESSFEFCDGDLLTQCAGPPGSQIDCTAVQPGFACQTVGENSFCGYASECDPADQGEGPEPDVQEWCDGDDVVFCNSGRYERVGCVDLGFERCEDTLSGRVACAPSGWVP